MLATFQEDSYMMFMANNNWYLFFRLHQILCDRLNKMYTQALAIASEENKDKKDRKESTAKALRLKPKSESASNLRFYKQNSA